MRSTRPLAVAVSLGIAAAIVVSAPASAADTAQHQTAKKAAPALSKSALAQNQRIVTSIRSFNRSYGVLRAQVTRCTRPAYPGTAALKTRARAELTRAATLRFNGVSGLKARSSRAVLNQKRASITRAVRGLAAINRTCAVARNPAAAPVVVTETVNVPGTPAGSTTVATPVTVGDLLGLGKVLPDGLLPQTLSIVDGLVPNLLSATNGVLALNPNTLIATLDGVLKGVLPACQLLDVGCLLNGVLATVNGLLGQVTGALTAGNLNELLTVGNLSGNVLSLLPTGALADLLAALPTDALESVLGTQVGVLHVLR